MDSLASRANHRILLGCALLCAAALLSSDATIAGVAEGPSSGPVAASNFPIASGARLAGDAKHTRFVLHLDDPTRFPPFGWPGLFGLLVYSPQVTFKLAPGTVAAGRGLIKAV